MTHGVELFTLILDRLGGPSGIGGLRSHELSVRQIIGSTRSHDVGVVTTANGASIGCIFGDVCQIGFRNLTFSNKICPKF